MTEKVVSLQWLRALAAWMVVFHHYIQVYRDFEPENKIEAFFTYHGSLGVDIFFVLSGLVMAMSISRGHVSAARFCRDRATRIIPAYWLATVVFLAVLPFANWDAVSFLHGSTLRDVLFSMLFIPHEHASGIGYIPVLTVGWTLNFEMFFYAILAVALLINKKWSLVIAVAVVLALPIGGRFGLPVGPIASNIVLFNFAFGVLIYLVGIKLFRMQEWPRRRRYTIAAICASVALASLELRFPWYKEAFSVAMVVGFFLTEDVFLKLSSGVGKIGPHLGDLSYSTYLFHVPVLLLVGALMDFSRGNDFWLVIAVCTITYITSLLSYYIVEMRFRRWLTTTIGNVHFKSGFRSLK